SSRRPHTRSKRAWSSDVCSSDLADRGRRDPGCRDLPALTPGPLPAYWTHMRHIGHPERLCKLAVDRADPKRRTVDRESAQVGSGAGAARGGSVEELALPDLCAAESEPLFGQAGVPELRSARSPTRLLE